VSFTGKGGLAVFKFRFIPREEGFFTLFEESAQNMVKAAQSLKQLVDTWQDVEQKAGEIDELEHRGIQLLIKLLRSCIAPLSPI